MSLATVDCVLRRNTLIIKQVYRVPFVRNSDSQTVMLWLCASKSYTFSQLIASYQHWHITVMNCNPIQCYRFFRLLTHIFWKHASFSQNSKHKSLNHSHKMQNPLYLLQNATLFSKQWYVTSKGYFVFKWQTQTIIWVDILSIDWTLMCWMENTTMKWENTSMKALSGALCLVMFSVTVRLLLL